METKTENIKIITSHISKKDFVSLLESEESFTLSGEKNKEPELLLIKINKLGIEITQMPSTLENLKILTRVNRNGRIAYIITE